MYLRKVGLDDLVGDDLEALAYLLNALMSGRSEDFTFEVEELDDAFDQYELNQNIGRLLWSDLEGLEALEVLSITGNLEDLDYYREEAEEEDEEFNEEAAAERALHNYYDDLAIEASSGRVDQTGAIWLYPRFFDRSGSDRGFDQLIKTEGYPLKEAVLSQADQRAIMKAVLNLVL
jgi:hypothetical protein